MSKAFFRTVFLALMLVVLVTESSAQVVNIEQKRLNKDTTGWVGTIDFHFNFTQNTRRVLQGGNRLQIAYVNRPHKVLLLNDINIVRAGREDLINNGFQHVRYNYNLNRTITAEAFTQVQYNAIQMQQLRFLVGSGPRFRILDNDTVRLFLGTLYMYEYEELTDGITFNRDHRISSYISLGVAPSTKFWFDHITYYQPRIDDFSDFRVSTETSLGIRLNPRISLNFRYGLNFDSSPPPEIPHTFHTFRNTIGFRF